MASRTKLALGIALLTGTLYAASQWRSSSDEMESPETTLEESS